MLHNMIQPQEEHLSIEEISSPFGAQLLEFCESDLFPETMQDSEVASTSNCCHDEQSSYPTNHSFNNSYMNTYNNIMHSDTKTIVASASASASVSAATATATAPSISPSTPTIITARDDCMSIIFGSTDDQIENDISDSIDFTTLSPSFPVYPYSQHMSNQEQFKISSIGNLFSLDMMDGSPHTAHQCISERQQTMVLPPPGVVPVMGPWIPAAYEGECGMPSVPSYLSLRSSLPGCALIDPMMGQYLHSCGINAPFSAENSGIFTGSGSLMGTDLSQELEFQVENDGILMPDSMPRVINHTYESQHLDVHGGPNTAPLTSEISSLEDPNFKVGKLSVEERKRKIHRYMKKRNERNFSKKIKYACRKTLADSRPRVRGRFAKNDELGDIGRSGGSNHEDDKDEEFSLFSSQIPADHKRKVVVRGEEDDIDSSDILAHISGVNSFKWYPIQSWI